MDKIIEAIRNGTATLQQIEAWWNCETINGRVSDLMVAMAMSRLFELAGVPDEVLEPKAQCRIAGLEQERDTLRNALRLAAGDESQVQKYIGQAKLQECDAIIDAFVGLKQIKFWTCPNGCNEFVEWNGDIATCEKCGATSRSHLSLMRILKTDGWVKFGQPDRDLTGFHKDGLTIAVPDCLECVDYSQRLKEAWEMWRETKERHRRLSERKVQYLRRCADRHGGKMTEQASMIVAVGHMQHALVLHTASEIIKQDMAILGNSDPDELLAWSTSGGEHIPKEPGIYVWEGTVRLLDPELDVTYSGQWRKATLEDITPILTGDTTTEETQDE